MIKLSERVYKPESTANPISANVFCADPTSVEFEGRLYVYGTNDHQQYEAVGDEGKNTYEQIKSLVVFSTDDMANWEYHGTIETEKIAPWIINSWAPSIVSREEADGLTHFYLYFSNSGNGVGVLTATHPLGPWSDPLGKPLIYQNMPGLENCPAPFDPGVCIDENGVGWLAFGGGVDAKGRVHTEVPKIVKLGNDMLSLDSKFVSIDAPYFFEASELNYVNGTYIYTYSSDWQPRDNWDRDDIPAMSMCSMGCLTSKTPLDSKSWEFQGGFFLNAGDSGMEWCNNHTHLMEYKNERYILHHTSHSQERMKTKGGFRCMCVDYLPYSDTSFPLTKATREGVNQIKAFNPYEWHGGAEMFTCADIGYEKNPESGMFVKSQEPGAWIYVEGVDFGKGTDKIILWAKGKGCMEIRSEQSDTTPLAIIGFSENDTSEIPVRLLETVSGVHNLYFVFSAKDICLEAWRAERKEQV